MLVGLLLMQPARLHAADAAPRQPNILVILTDQQHARMLGCAGNSWLETPALDGLAATGARFTRAYCVNPVCVPSRTGMFTGHTPARFGIENNSATATVRMPAEVHQQGVGSKFREAGYEVAYAGKVHVVGGVGKLGFTALEVGHGDEGTATASAAFLGQARDKPFFLVASFVNPHDICYLGKGGGDADGENANIATAKANVATARKRPTGVSDEEFFARLCPPLPENFGPQRDAPEAVPHREGKWSTEQWREYRWVYHRLTEQVDRDIGRVLEALRGAGLEEQTLVVFTSDHGDMDASHRLRNKGRFFEESVGVPFIVSLKGVTRPGLVDDRHLVSTGMDLIPTLCDYAGIEPPAGLPGRSVRPLAEGRDVPEWRPYVVSETSGGRMVCSGRYKYCVYEKGTLREQLVDLETDPGEMQNLAASPAHAGELARHRAFLSEWIGANQDRLAAGYVIQ